MNKDSLKVLDRINIIKEFYKKMNSKKYTIGNFIIKLPKTMTIGAEIESEGIHSNLIRKIIKNLKSDWEEEIDTSLNSGVEVKSPIIHGNDEQRVYEMNEICLLLNRLGQKISDRCGGHIHIGSDYLTTKESWMNLLQLWSNNEELLYIIANKEGEAPRIMLSSYAKPYSGALEKKLNEKTVQLDTIEDVKKLAKDVQNGTGDYGINFKNLGNEKNTIESRIPNGTIDAKTWIENINLFGGIVKAAEDLAIIQNKKAEDRTDEEITKLRLFEMLNNDGISDSEKIDKEEISHSKGFNKDGISDSERLEILLQIVIPSEDRDIYRRRYRTNSKLYEKSIVRDFIRAKLSKKKIKFNSTRINKFGVEQRASKNNEYTIDDSDREEK